MNQRLIIVNNRELNSHPKVSFLSRRGILQITRLQANSLGFYGPQQVGELLDRCLNTRFAVFGPESASTVYGP